MNSRLISVLIPSYNSEKWIFETIQSVIDQTYNNLEIICCDDGSTDNTLSILKSINDPRFKFYSQNNAGAGAARNAAFEKSLGELVIFIDSDDLIEINHIEALSSVLLNKDLCVAFSRWDRFYSEKSEATFPDRPTDCSMDGPSWVSLDLERVNMMQCGMFLIPRKLINLYGGWNPHLSIGPCDDFEFFCRILSNCNGVIFASDAKLFYRSGIIGSLSRSRTGPSMTAKYESLYLGTQHLIAKKNNRKVRLVCANIIKLFIYDIYPHHENLLMMAEKRIGELGGSNINPDGPPGFHYLRRIIGWKGAKHIQLFFTRYGLNRASLIKLLNLKKIINW